MMYKKPLMEVIEFKMESVILTSNPVTEKPSNVGNEGFSEDTGEEW